jgi:hypothetical protein
MIPDWASASGKALGDQIAAFVEGNAPQFGLEYLIWQQMYRPVGGSPNLMEDRGSPTQNHFDHVHATTKGNAGTGGALGGAQVTPTIDAQVLPATTSTTNFDGTTSSTPGTSSSSSSSSRPASVGGILGDFLQANVDDALGTLGFSPSSDSYVGQALKAGQNAMQPPATTPPSTGSTYTPGSPTSTQTGTFAAPGTAQVVPQITYDPSKGADQWRPLIKQALQMMGSALSNEDRTAQQVAIESGGNPNAVNNTDSNAAKGDPSKGLLQCIKTTFDAMVHPSLKDRGQTDPLANLTAGIGWAIHRYGGPEKIWPTKAGYKDGGWIRGVGGPTDDANDIRASNGEFMVQAARAQQWPGLLEAINTGRLDRAVTQAGGAGVSGGDYSIRIENLQTGMSRSEFDRAMRDLKTEQRDRSKSYSGSRR